MLTRLSHVAMSVPAGTLTDEYRAAVLEFYGQLLGWKEIESLRLPDRLTVLVGPDDYINIREQPSPMTCSGYEHFGVVMASADEADALWDRLNDDQRDLHLEPNPKGADGFRSYKFRYLLPLAVEVQAFPRPAAGG
jgi:hypothetical protein